MLTKFLRAALPKVKPIEFINFTSATANATSITLNKPTNTAEGDLMILVFQTQSSLTITLPAGWVTIVNAYSSTPELRTTILYKVALASEPSSYSVGISSARGIQGGIMTYRNARYSAFSGVSVSGTASSLNVSITPSSTDSVVIHYSGRQSSSDLTSTPIAGFTELFENFASGSFSNSNLQISHVVPVGTTDTTDVSNTWSTSGGMSAAMIELVPSTTLQVVGIASYGATTSSTTHTINYPEGTQDGDLVICFFGTGLNGASITVTGFTTIFANAYSGATAGIYRKTVSGESSVTATMSSSTGTAGGSLIVIRNGSYAAYDVDAPSNSEIDPPSLSANIGDIVATFGMSATSTAVTGIAESGYTVSSAQATAVRNMPFVVGYKLTTSSGTEEPPAYTFTPSGVSDTAETLAFTVRVTP